MAPVLPSPVVPIARRVLREMVGHLVVDARPEKLGPAIAGIRESGARLNLNLLGEAVLGEQEALRRLEGIHELIRRDDVDYVSVKVSAIASHISMWAFDDFTADNGATRVVPGSHKWPSGDYDADLPTVTVEMPAGSVIFYPGTVLHAGGANRTDRPRLGVILEYVAGWLRPQENHLLAVPREVAAELSPELQELLGYNVYPPFVGYVDGRHPRRSLQP